MHAKIKYDEALFERLYMEGRPTSEIVEAIGCKESLVLKNLKKMEWAPNNEIFKWQKKLKPSEFALIPMKYRDKRLCV